MSQQPVNPTLPPTYPATLSIDYPDRPLNRLTSFFRIFTVIPIAIIVALLSGGSTWRWGEHTEGWQAAPYVGGSIFLALVLMILFRKKYPKWWFDWNLALTRFSYRVSAYFLLLRDEYPSTDEQQSVHLDLVYPDAQNQLGRGWPLIKWFLAIPHYVVIFFLAIAVFWVTVFVWFAILFTGRYPRGLFDFTVGVGRWGLRVSAYALLLITDKYPAFSLEP
jgi:hypothetical protein